MPLSDAYATPQQYRATLVKTDTGKDDDIAADLEAMSRYIEKKTHTFFNRDEVLVSRYYMPASKMSDGGLSRFSSNGAGWAESENPWRFLKGEQLLIVDPIADATDIEIIVDSDRNNSYVGETPLTSLEFKLLPRNVLVGPAPKPYTHIQKLDSSGHPSIWLPGCEVRVTAYFGYPAVPKEIERSTINMTGILRLETPRATQRIQDFDRTADANSDIQKMVYALMMSNNRQLGI